MEKKLVPSSNQMMSNLVSSFLNLNFESEETPKVIRNKKTPDVDQTEANKQPNYASMSPKGLFKYFTLKYFAENNGSKAILDEFDSSLTYLNVYRKNHLKQFIENTIETQTNQINVEKITYEEAMQSKAK